MRRKQYQAFPLIPLPVKEATDLLGSRLVYEKLFPLIPLPVKEATILMMILKT